MACESGQAHGVVHPVLSHGGVSKTKGSWIYGDRQTASGKAAPQIPRLLRHPETPKF